MELGQQAARTGARLKAAGPREEAGCGLAVAQAADGRRRESGRAQACSQSIGRIGPRDGGEGGEDAELELDEDNFGEEEATENLGGRETDLIGSESSSESRSVEFRAGEEEDLMLLSRYNLIEDTYDCFRVESNGDSNDNRPRVSPSVASRARLEHRKLAIERRLKRRQVCGEFMPIGSRFGEKGPAPLPNGRRLRAANQMMNSLTESCCGAGEQQFSAGQGARRLLLLDGEAIERSEGSVNCASSNRSASSASYASTLSTASASTRHSNSISPSEQPALTLAASPLADFEDGRPELEFELAGSSFGGAAGQEQDLGLAQLHGRERRQSADGLALANWQASRAERASVHRRRQQQRASAWQPAESPSRQVGAGAEAEEGAEAYGNGAENENENNHVVVVVESETPSSSSGGRSATSKARTQSDQGESTKAPPVSATEPLAKQDERRQQQIGRLHHMETQAAPDLVPKRPHSPLAGDISSSEAKRDFSSSAERQAQQSGESCQRRPRQVGASAVDNIATLTQSNCAGAGQRNQYSNCSNRCDESDAIQANNCHSQQQQQQLIELEEEAETTLPGSENNNICSSSSSSSRIDKLPSRHDRLSGEREEFESDSKTEAAPSGRQQELNREHMSAVAAIGQAPQLAENNSIEQRAAQRKLIALKVARSGVGRSDDRPKLAADSMPTSSSTPPTNFSSSSSTSSVGSTTSSSVTTNLSFNSGSNNMISAGYQSPVAFCNQTAAYAVGQSQLLDVDSSRGKSQLQQQQRLGSNDTIYDQQQERSSVPVELKQLPLKQEQQTNHQFAQQQSRQQQQQPQYPQYPPNHPLGNTKHLCSICGDRATGKHYGVFSCEGCKGFFKRTIRKDIIYVCRSRGDCLIDMRQRNRCQYCRYQKCLRQGMKREAVQEEKQRLKLRAAAAAVAAGSITTSVTTNNNSSIFKLIDSNNNNSNCDINNNTFSMSEHNNNNNNNINNMIATHAGPNAHPSAPTQPHLNQFPSPVGGYTNQTQDYNASSNNNSAQLNHQNSIQHFNTVTSNYLHFKQDQNSLAHQQQLHLHQTGLSQFEAPSNNAHDLQLLNHQNPFELHQTHVNTQARTSSGSSSSSSSSTVSSSNCFAANNLNYPIGQAYSTIAQQQQPQISPASINTQTRLPVMRESYGNYYNTSGCLGGSESGSTTSSMSSTSHDQGLGAYLKPSKRLNSRIDELTLKWAAQCQIESLLEWAKSVPKFKELLIDDQITLLKAYWNELIISDIAFKSVDSIKENNQKQQRSLCIGRNLFIHESQSHEIGLSNVFERIVNDIVLKIHDMRIDSNELACLRAIILFNPETQGLKTSQPIEELRANVYTSLEAYCRKNYENQPNRFGKLLLRLPDLRSIGLKCDSIRRDNLDQNNNSSSNSNFKTSFNGCDQISPNTPQQTTTPMNPFGTSNNFNNVNGLNSPPSANQFHHNHNHHLHHHYHGTHTAGSGPANSSTKLQGYQVKLLFFDICYESSAIDSFLRSNLSR